MAKVAVSVGLLLSGGAGVQAQEARESTPAGQVLTRSYTVAPQPLETAVPLLARQSGRQISADAALLQGLATQGVEGMLTFEEALRRLLSGTGLVFRPVSGTTVLIERAVPGAANSDPAATQLDPLQVQGFGVPQQAMIDNIPPPYAGGQVASGSQLGILGNRDILDAPFNVISYTEELIRNQQARSIADVVENDPSVRNVFPRASGIDQFTIRGFLAPNQDVMFGGLYGMVPSASNSMALEGVERVEILKGPNALLNGIAPSGNIGGAINIIPKRATNEPITRATGLYNSVSQFGASFDAGRRYGEEKQYGIRFNGLMRKGNTPTANNVQETQLATLGLDFRGDRVRVGIDLGYQYQDSTATPRGIRVAPGVPVPGVPSLTSNYVPPWTFAQQKDAFVVTRAEVDILENVTAFAGFGAKNGWNRFLAGFPTVLTAQGDLTTPPFYSTTYVTNLTAEAGFRGVFHTGPIKHQASLGATGFWQDTGTVRSTTAAFRSNLYGVPANQMPNLAGLPTNPTKTASSQLTSLALADTLSIWSERIQLTAGFRLQRARAENFSPTTGAQLDSYDDSAVTPAFGLVVRPWTNVSFYGNYIQALTQGATAPVGAANVGQIFAPYRSEQFEFGSKVDFGTVTATLSFFQIQQPVGIIAPLTQVFGIDGQQRNRGIELNVFGEPTAGLRLLGGVMLLEGTQVNTAGGINNGRTAIGAPVVNLNVGAEWDMPQVKGLTLTGRTIYTGSQYLDAANTQSIPGWARLDVGARYATTLAGKEVTFRAELLNLLGTNYWASTIGGTLISGTPRTALLSATVGF